MAVPDLIRKMGNGRIFNRKSRTCIRLFYFDLLANSYTLFNCKGTFCGYYK